MPTGVKAKAPRVKTVDPTSVTAGSDNVFADFGLPNPELYQAKAHFVRALRNAIKHRKLDHHNAAAILKIAPDKLEALLRGQTKATQSIVSFGWSTHLGILWKSSFRLSNRALPPSR